METTSSTQSSNTFNTIDHWPNTQSTSASYQTVDHWPNSQSSTGTLHTVDHWPNTQTHEDESDLASQYIIADAWNNITTQNSLQDIAISDEQPAQEEEDDVEYGAGMQAGAGNTQAPLAFTTGTVQRGFRNAVLVEKLIPSKPTNDLVYFLMSLMQHLEPKLQTLLNAHHGIKYWVNVEVLYKNPTDNTSFTIYLDSHVRTLLNAFKLSENLQEVSEEILGRNANLLRKTSQATIENIASVTIKASSFRPLAGSSYQELPKYLDMKKCIINVRNTDNRCFGYSILAAIMNLEKNGTRASNYDAWFRYYGLNTLQYPMQPTDISTVEDQLHMNINLFSFFDDEGKGRYPLYVSRKEFPRTIDLLYWNEHYAWLKKFDRFIYDVTKHKAKKYICRRCFGHFSSEAALANHTLLCSRPDFSKSLYTLPPPGSTITFTNIRFQQATPFVIYADSECLIFPIEKQVNGTTFLHTHQPCSIGFKLVSTIPELANEHYECYTGLDVVDWFLRRLREIEQKCMRFLFDDQRLFMTLDDERAFAHAFLCYICQKPMAKGDKVRDHDHITGKYRGAAHNKCNLLLRKTYKIPVFFHNFRGYDSHLIVWGFKNHPALEIRLIGQGMEKYLVINWGDHLVFKDSYQFMAASLDQLSQNLLKSGKENLKQVQKAFSQNPPDDIELLYRKGIFPYEYMDEWKRMDESHLPPIESFFSHLTKKACNAQDYQHALNVWQKFKCAKMQDYLELYLKTDVLLLADVFEAFRNVCMANYGLDPAQYVSSPQLSWDAMLKQTACKLDLISDPEMFRFVDPGIRGGISVITQRFAKANNPYMQDLYDPTKPNSYIIYLDANNLYGWAMSQSMPYSNFKWVTEEEFKEIDWGNQTEEQDIGYFIECDLVYPEDVHDEHNEYPLAPERMNIHVEQLSEMQVNLRKHYKMQRGGMNTKLVPNLMGKERYKCHYLNLMFYLQHGLRLAKVHRVLQFKQSKWLAPYIELNSNLRAASKTDFEKDFFKLMNNAV